jgi:hypothetical protein
MVQSLLANGLQGVYLQAPGFKMLKTRWVKVYIGLLLALLFSQKHKGHAANRFI